MKVHLFAVALCIFSMSAEASAHGCFTEDGYPSPDPDAYPTAMTGEALRDSILAQRDDILQIERTRIVGDVVLPAGSFVRRMLVLSKCMFDGGMRAEEDTFARDVQLENNTFVGGVCFLKSAFTGHLSFECSVFRRGVLFFFDSLSHWANFQWCTYGDSGASFRDCVFSQGACFIWDSVGGKADFSFSVFGGEADFSQSSFRGGANFFYSYFTEPALFEGVVFSQPTTFDGATFGRVSFRHARVPWTVAMDGVSIETSADLRFMRFVRTSADSSDQSKTKFLAKTYFADRCQVSLPEEVTPFSIRLEDLNRVLIKADEPDANCFADSMAEILIGGGSTRDPSRLLERIQPLGAVRKLLRSPCFADSARSEAIMELSRNLARERIDADRKLNNVIAYVNSQRDAPQELKGEVLQRLNWQLFRIDKEYETWPLKQSFWSNFLTKRESWPWLRRLKAWIWDHVPFAKTTPRGIWLWIVEKTVNAGYRGGGRFFISVVLIILPFSFYYSRWSSSKKLLDFLGTDVPRRWGQGFWRLISDWFLLWMHALWFSFMVFVSPKFKLEYFKFGPALRAAVILEYSFGTFMIIMYLVYIASNYAFIKALLGMG